MPPELLDVLEAYLTTKTWRPHSRPPEPDLAGARDRALLLVGSVGTLRCSELLGLDFEHVNDQPPGLSCCTSAVKSAALLLGPSTPSNSGPVTPRSSASSVSHP